MVDSIWAGSLVFDPVLSHEATRRSDKTVSTTANGTEYYIRGFAPTRYRAVVLTVLSLR